MAKYTNRVSMTITISPNTKKILEEYSKEMELPISRIIDFWAKEKEKNKNVLEPQQRNM